MESITITGVCGIQKFSWVLSKDSLTVQSGNAHSETAIPLSQIKNVSFSYAPWGGGGRIDVGFGAGPSGFVKLTGGVTLSNSGKEFLIFKKDSTKNAELIRDYINNYLTTPSDHAASSLADELAKLKSLWDAGTLSQAEFDAAKKKLLDL